jgi:hypothetical protein
MCSPGNGVHIIKTPVLSPAGAGRILDWVADLRYSQQA